MPALVLLVQRMHPVSKCGFNDTEKGDGLGMAVCFLVLDILLPLHPGAVMKYHVAFL